MDMDMDVEKRGESPQPDEKAGDADVVVLIDDVVADQADADADKNIPRLDRFARKVTSWITRYGLEGHGIEPVPAAQRTDPRLYQMFFVWFTANMNITTLSAGTVGPAVFGLGMRDSFVVIVLVDIIACAFPAFFVVLGPKLGTRAMVQSRFSWGYYGAIIPSVLNVLSMQGYVIINCIVGGQMLASVSTHLGDAAGIVITGLISLGVTFCGYQVLHWYEMLAWIPNVVAFIVLLGVSGKTLTTLPLTSGAPATPASVLSFVSTLSTTIVSWSTISPDYGIFHDAKASGLKIFIYAYLGFLISSITVHLLGAALTVGADVVPAWDVGFEDGNNVGGLVGAALAPAGGFGRLLVVLMALTVPSAVAPTMYTVCTSFMTIAAVFARVPRCVFALLSTAVLIPVGIVGAAHFYATFVQILSFIGYWIAPFMAIIITEHYVFRKGRWANYDPENAWNKPSHPNLARGYAALFTFVTSIPLIVVCMAQTEWVGPVARKGTGDIAMFVSFVYAIMAYWATRWLELRGRT